MSDNSAIRATLEARLASVSGLPEVVWTDEARDPDTAVPYIRGTFLAQTKRPLDNLVKVARGMLQLDVLYPLSQDASADAMAALIEAAYPMTGLGLTLDDGQTHIEYSQAENGVPDGNWWRVPVVVSWTHYYN